MVAFLKKSILKLKLLTPWKILKTKLELFLVREAELLLACRLQRCCDLATRFQRDGALTVLITAAGCTVFSFRLAGAAVGSGRRRGRSSAGSSTFAFIQEAIHVISAQHKQLTQHCPRY